MLVVQATLTATEFPYNLGPPHIACSFSSTAISGDLALRYSRSYVSSSAGISPISVEQVFNMLGSGSLHAYRP